MTAKYEIIIRVESKDDVMKIIRLVTDGAGFSTEVKKVHPAKVESKISEEELANDLSETSEPAAQGLRDLIDAGLVEAFRNPNGEINYRITEFGRSIARLGEEERYAILRRLDLLNDASDTEH